MIIGANLVKKFASAVEVISAVDGVSIEASAGEFIALMGPSGCGKSTLLGLIGGMTKPTEGFVSILGTTLGTLSENGISKLRREHLGLIFQEHNLIEEFTASENVMLPVEIAGLTRNQAISEAAKALSHVALADKARAYPHQLSGGQKQRVGIARALVGEKRIILADEPTGSLDSTNSRRIFAIFQSLARQGFCVIVATHDEAILSYATRLLKMRDGQIIEDSGIAECLS